MDGADIDKVPSEEHMQETHDSTDVALVQDTIPAQVSPPLGAPAEVGAASAAADNADTAATSDTTVAAAAAAAAESSTTNSAEPATDKGLELEGSSGGADVAAESPAGAGDMLLGGSSPELPSAAAAGVPESLQEASVVPDSLSPSSPAADVGQSPAAHAATDADAAAAAAAATAEAEGKTESTLGQSAKDPAPLPDLEVEATPVPGSMQAGAAGAGTSSAGSAGAASEIGETASSSRLPDKVHFVDGVRAIDVEVDCGSGLPCKLLHVTLDVSDLQHSIKPYLGGLRHKQTGTVFHHASIQTPQDQGPSSKPHKQRAAAGSSEQQDVCWSSEKLTRETQTVKAASCSSQTVREAATQMAAPGLLLDCSRDRVLTPRPYVSSEVVAQRREAAAMTIQRFSRGWQARKCAAVLRDIKAERDAFLAETAAESAQAAQEHKRREVEHRTHPLSKADFALLEAELDSWRQQQTSAIKAAGLDHKEEQAALQLLLAKETRLLHTLDKLRVAAHQERRATGRQQQLGGLAQPKTWALSNGKKVLVHTPLTVRAAELQQLYRGLTLSSLSLDERLDVLLHVKWVTKEYDCSTTRELVELIDREADLLNRGRSPNTLDGLRKRIAGLFLTCCQNPAFNPEAARLRVNAVGANGPEAFEYVLEQHMAL